MLYLVSLFLHVIGALLYFASLSIEWLCHIKLKGAESSDKFNEWLSIYSSLHMISGISWILILVPGIYMMAVIWKDAAWLTTAFVGFLLIVIVGSIVTGRKMKPIINEIKTAGFTPGIQNLFDNQVLNFSLKVRTTLTIGIVFLMTVKPGLSESIMTLLISLILGFLPVIQSKKEKTIREVNV
jgi:uncharacterized membrane protein SirB2